ncbi:hypothetical protein AMATHDRAFT_192811 [Amanita thiersii Skay4041]|uniref:BD-FAE-like domain-containing protein n=1 Tax=Amanita thiersii Skay4041 TaxID=703135 RepID=A0A2A9NSC2_9AGAR|nr:hypothetical protein AMATHDRAFT_192811 [Amanita thiersii Skay4041]
MELHLKEQFLDISYSQVHSDVYHQFDIYLTRPVHPHQPLSLPPLICFVHGGAWISQDKKEHADLARDLATRTKYPVVVPNYRLSPREPTEHNLFHHPGHASDILECLTFLLTWEGPLGLGSVYDPQQIYLIGHSCSAHILSSIFLDSSSITPSLTPPNLLLQSVKGIILAQGIYDIDLLLSSFPNYRTWFIEPAFGKQDSYAPLSVTNCAMREPNISWCLVHSKGDPLVDTLQSNAMYNHLCRLVGESGNGRIKYGGQDLLANHYDVIKSDPFLTLVANFIKDNTCSMYRINM